MSRPPKEINWNIVEKRLEAGCSAKEIAAVFSIKIDTFYRRFKEEYGVSFGDYGVDFQDAGKANIKYTQYMKALSGNVNMLLLLGKEWLGQGKEESKDSPYQDTITLSHENILLRAHVADLQEKLNKVIP